MADKQRNTVKVAILEGDSIIEDLIAITVIFMILNLSIFFQVQFQTLNGRHLLNEYSVKNWTRKCHCHF